MIKLSSGSGLHKVFETTVSHPQQSGSSKVTYTINHNKGVIIKDIRCIITNPSTGIAISTPDIAIVGSTYYYHDFIVSTLNKITVDIYRQGVSAGSGPFNILIELYA